jgi:hypothetical protein
MKKYFALILYLILINYINSENLNYNNIVSGFCDYRFNSFNNGINIQGKNHVIISPISGELIFHNITRSGSITYGIGNFIALQDLKSDLRYCFSHLKEDSTNTDKIYYQKGDKIGITGNSGFEEKQVVHIDMQKIDSKEFKNPLEIIKINDTLPPIIEDVYFLNDDKKISIADFRNFKIKKGGKLFVNCYDKINDSEGKITPYKITVIVDGNEIATLKFDSLLKLDYNYVNQDGKSLNSIYSNNTSFDYFLTDFTSLPKVIGFKLLVEDYNGNIREFKRNLKIEF